MIQRVNNDGTPLSPPPRPPARPQPGPEDGYQGSVFDDPDLSLRLKGARKGAVDGATSTDPFLCAPFALVGGLCGIIGGPLGIAAGAAAGALLLPAVVGGFGALFGFFYPENVLND